MATPAEKQQSLATLMEKGVVMLHLDARRPGVRVPEHLKAQSWLRLNFNHQKGKGDIQVNDWGLRETLRFNGQWSAVAVPWSAIFAISLPEQADAPTIFAEDLPEEMVEAALARLQREGASLEDLEEKRPVPLWPARPSTPVSMAPSPQPQPQAMPTALTSAPPPAPEQPKRSHLRLVK
jgi:stringent starvation protein B